VPAWYDQATKECKISIEGLILTIPDYMTISDVVYFIEEHQLKGAQRLMQEVTYGQSDQESPLEKAMSHYKERGWFRSNDDD
jgi:hypothetical protein